MEKALVVWREGQTSNNIPTCKSLIQSKVLSIFKSVKAERSEEAAVEAPAAHEVGSWDLSKEAIFMTSKYRVNQQVLI